MFCALVRVLQMLSKFVQYLPVRRRRHVWADIHPDERCQRALGAFSKLPEAMFGAKVVISYRLSRLMVIGELYIGLRWRGRQNTV